MFTNVLKKAAQKAAQFAYDHFDYVKEQVDAYNGVQKALNDEESFKVDEVSITNIVLDEAAKCQARIHGFKLCICTDANRTVTRVPIYRLRTKESFMDKIGFLGRFKRVETIVDQAANFAATKAVQQLMAETLIMEVDGQDAIHICPERIKALWWQIAKRGESIEEITRQVVRHEFRHAEQFLALRKVGGSKLVNQMFNLEMRALYGNRIMERDAWNEQHLPSYRPIEEFVEEALAAVAAH